MANLKFAIEHAAIWAAIDELAVQVGLSVTALAIKCNIDPGTLSPGKRRGSGGRLRWPSLETLTAVLTVTGTSYQEFGRLVDAICAMMEPAEPESSLRSEDAA